MVEPLVEMGLRSQERIGHGRATAHQVGNHFVVPQSIYQPKHVEGDIEFLLPAFRVLLRQLREIVG